LRVTPLDFQRYNTYLLTGPAVRVTTMNERHIVYLGLGLLISSSAAFLVTWRAVGRSKNTPRVGVERTWFRCLAVCFYVGLAVLLASAVGSVVQNTLKGIK
jgi:hypothetical protein